MTAFDYDIAFSRNIGWVSEEEQSILKKKRIAIAGMGGVGGGHLLSLVRLGIGNFHIADFDSFDLPNFNRQTGAMMSTLNQPKTRVLASMARDINPSINITSFDNGVTSENIDNFLKDVDLYVDGVDFFAFEARRTLFAACREKRIPAITAAPLGMGVAFLCFMPDSMSFEDYFCLDGCDKPEMALRFLVGLAPAMLQRGYLVDLSRVNFIEQRGPSTVASCQLCSGVITVESLKILLQRGGVPVAPHGYQFDAYRNRYAKTWRPGGNRHPLQKLALAIGRRQLLK